MSDGDSTEKNVGNTPAPSLLDEADWGYLARREREHLRKEAAKLDPNSGIGRAWACCKRLPRSFTLAQLTIACWSQYRDTFGMRGAPEHPSDHRTRGCLYGPRGLLAKGLVRGDGTGNYETMI